MKRTLVEISDLLFVLSAIACILAMGIGIISMWATGTPLIGSGFIFASLMMSLLSAAVSNFLGVL